MMDVRTTIDLPDDLHRRAQAIARDTSRSFSATVADLIRRGLGETRPAEVSRSQRTGLPVVRLGTIITSEDVRALEDDEPYRAVTEP
jgi:predicted transcriptional regulator